MKILKNTIILLIVISLIVIAFFSGAHFIFANRNESIDIANGVTLATVVFLGMVSLFDLFQKFGWDVLVPTFLQNFKYNEMKKQISLFYENDSEVIRTNDERRFKYMIQQLDIPVKDYNKWIYQLIVLQNKDLKSNDDIKNRILDSIFKFPGLIKVQSDRKADRTYPAVKYYIDFNYSMRESILRNEISKTFAYFIRLQLEALNVKLKEINKIVIPYDSNFLLGINVGEILQIPQVFIRNKSGRIFENEPWDGAIESTDRVIIIHDVLVTSKQIKDAVEKIKAKYSNSVVIEALFCVIRRKDKSFKNQEYRENIKYIQDNCNNIISICDLNDAEIERYINKYRTQL